MFIVIDGIDGSGKGTQLLRVKEALEKSWKTVLVLDFPRHWEDSAFAVKKYLNWEYGMEVSAKQSSLFYAIDRYDAANDFSKKMKNYDYVISNRYVSANMIHQWWKIHDTNERKEFLNWVDDLEYNVFQIPRPDITIFLNVSPEMSQKLVEKKEVREYIQWDENKDIHEADEDHLIQAHSVACDIVEQFDDWIRIDCEENWHLLSREIITEKILNTIKN